MDATEASGPTAAATQGLKRLISARVDDTNVYDTDGHKLGSVYTFHIDRWSGQAEFAVLSFGGFLGLGQSYHPVPFQMLSVNEDRGGYVLHVGKSVLEGGPSYRPDSAPAWDSGYAQRISDYYGISPRSGTF
ncbi:MAG TPA: PRC-barrel domain-containing protein [Allosphingosinicella sp.]|nr:PRC-barrel domain-containing protein [Allosphingosinicella sp.]